MPVYSPAIWGICIPSRVQVFLWLLSHNELLTRDNLSKRKKLDDVSCIFCAEQESISHLFFECCVAANAWEVCSEILLAPVGSNFESVAWWWISKNKHVVVLNICTSAILWSLWNVRNAICFQGGVVRREDGGTQGDKDDAAMVDSVQGRKFFGGPGEAAGGPCKTTTEDCLGCVYFGVCPTTLSWVAPRAGSLSASGARRVSGPLDYC